MASSIAIVAGSFHKELVEKMVEEARITASENDLIVEEVSWVPGSMEVHLQLKQPESTPLLQVRQWTPSQKSKPLPMH